jgi:hypothetical protein
VVFTPNGPPKIQRMRRRKKIVRRTPWPISAGRKPPAAKSRVPVRPQMIAVPPTSAIPAVIA